MTTSNIQHYSNEVKNLNKSLTNMPKQVSDMKADALALFEKIGLPTRKQEDWKYIDLNSLRTASYQVKKKDSNISNIELPDDIFLGDDFKIAIIDGKFSKERSELPKDIVIECLNINDELSSSHEILPLINIDKENPFDLLNYASFSELIRIAVPKNTNVKKSITIAHITSSNSDNSILSPRIIIEVGEFSKVNFFETFTTLNSENVNYLMNTTTSIAINESASVEHVKSVQDSLSSIHIGKIHADVAKYASFKSFTFNTGSKIARNNLKIDLNDIEAFASSNGVYTLNGGQVCDNFINIDHNVEKTVSSQLFKGVLSDSSRAAFTGKITIHRDAQQSSSEQLNRNLILSDKAYIQARPQLEIYADDVKCTHGATTGQMNSDELFYLQSRGMEKDRAQKVLCHAFAKETISKIDSIDIKEKLTVALNNKLNQFL